MDGGNEFVWMDAACRRPGGKQAGHAGRNRPILLEVQLTAARKLARGEGLQGEQF